MTDCPRRDAWLRGCRFEPRYDEGEPMAMSDVQATRTTLLGMIEASKPRTYVRDVCVTCGRTVEREGKS